VPGKSTLSVSIAVKLPPREQLINQPLQILVKKLALRARSQCLATLEALAEMKRPKSVAYVGQATIAHGH